VTSDDISKISAALKKKYENMPESVREYWNKRIDEEFKRRNKKGSIADDPDDYAKGRELGEQDIGDLSYKDVWQKVFRDKTGYTVPIGKNYKCPVCGGEYALDMPPDKCIFCGCKSYLHLGKICNLRNR
jgi:hypothetical protein